MTVFTAIVTCGAGRRGAPGRNRRAGQRRHARSRSSRSPCACWCCASAIRIARACSARRWRGWSGRSRSSAASICSRACRTRTQLLVPGVECVRHRWSYLRVRDAAAACWRAGRKRERRNRRVDRPACDERGHAAARHRADGPDRLGQDRAGAGMGAALRRRNRQRRFGAGVSRARHRRGQADARRTRARAAPPDRPARSVAAVFGGGIRRDARAAIDGIVARGKLPILAGGTGLYFHALLQGLAPMPEADPAHARSNRRTKPQRAAGRRCTPNSRAIDPARRRAHPRHRCATHPARAGGVARAAGARSATGSAMRRGRGCRCACSSWCWRRATARVLHARIERRFDAMLRAGFLDEVRRAARAAATAGASGAAGPAGDARGRLSPGLGAPGRRRPTRPSSATARIFATRQLAKRQLTWLRGELDARWFDPASATRSALEHAAGAVRRQHPLDGARRDASHRAS